MNHRDTMRDPRYAGILLVIERQLAASDRLAATRGLTLTDSNIRSLLVRAINEAKGKAAKADASASSDKDRFLAEAQRELTAVRATIIEERDQPDGSVERRPLPAAEWLAALEAIKDSCAVRTGREPGSRGYLEFVREFLKGAGQSR